MAYNEEVELFRDTEYPMLQDTIYLDHSGSTIYATSLITQFSQKLISNLYGNPHSASNPARLSGHEVDRIRNETLQFFNADPEHFDLIFTANATAAIKLVAESFRDLALTSSPEKAFWYGYHKDAHTSLVGVRELTTVHRCFTSDEEVEQWLDDGPSSLLSQDDKRNLPGLFAYAAQSNMTGRRLPLSWTGRLRKSSKPAHQNTYSLLDAAALAANSPLDFSDADAAPDFTAVSFYKIFGFPDLGALIVRRESGHILSWRRYFGGGTVNMITVFHEATVQRKDNTLHDALEDGTLPFHNIIALGCAMQVHKQLYGSMQKISKHTSFLANRMYTGISELRHFNGRQVCIVYNDANAGEKQYSYSNATTQGATVAFNVVKADGTYVGHSVVESLANEKGIYLRSGGLCNAGGIASYLEIKPWQFKRMWSSGYRCGAENSLEIINGKPTGVVRASLGAMSILRDVDAFIDFLRQTFVEVSMIDGCSESATCQSKDSAVSFGEHGTVVEWDRTLPNTTKRVVSPISQKPAIKLRPSKSFNNGRNERDTENSDIRHRNAAHTNIAWTEVGLPLEPMHEKSFAEAAKGARLRHRKSGVSLRFWKPRNLEMALPQRGLEVHYPEGVDRGLMPTRNNFLRGRLEDEIRDGKSSSINNGKNSGKHTAYTMTAEKTVPATAAPSTGSSVEPIMLWWFDLKRAPMTERITMAKTEMTMLFSFSTLVELFGLL
ncbi:hypothetical protein G7Y89_g12218 [Cudoniella acicularis]|uniref:Aminotransferase class V domain-containing protein n=1 Tax=Cudoniella acicularis TaxID=354080 RepID=A0A8H4VX84_9HELO|nr:hypothetical protein G7Y89_g12218 [Cudoniella acicularis]